MSDALDDFLTKKEEPAKAYSEKIEEMMNDERYEWAGDTLTSIYDFILMNGYISQKQMDAVDNIKKSLWRRHK